MKSRPELSSQANRVSAMAKHFLRPGVPSSWFPVFVICYNTIRSQWARLNKAHKCRLDSHSLVCINMCPGVERNQTKTTNNALRRIHRKLFKWSAGKAKVGFDDIVGRRCPFDCPLFRHHKWSDVSNDLLSKADTKALADFRSKSVTNATCNFFSL